MRYHKKNIIITGSARSGTSWVSELMAKPFRFRLLFEPEHDTQTKYGNLICDKFLESKQDSQKAHNYLKKVFANQVDSNWIAQHSNRKWKMHLWPFLAKKHIIKFVRCNLSAKYINEAFGIPVLHIIRNPYDVLHSQQRVKFPWLYDLSYFKDQPKLISLLKNQFDFDFEEKTSYSDLEILTIRWCIENEVLINLQKPYNKNFRVILYEDLRKSPELFIELCNFFKLKSLENIIERYNLPSSKTHPKSKIRNKDAIKKSFNSEELNRINAILDKFKSTLYPRKTLLQS